MTSKKPHDEEAAKGEREGTYVLNYGILKDWEEYNFGGKQVFIRNGENSVYTNIGNENSAIPIGLPVAFSDPNFVRKFQQCPHLRANFKGFDFECKRRQDVSPPLATDEQIEEIMDSIRACLAEAKSRAYAKKKPKYVEV